MEKKNGRLVKALVFHAIEYIVNTSDVIVKNKNYEIKEIEDMPRTFANEIGCCYIDVVKRKIGKKLYNIICDEDESGNSIIALLDKNDQTKNVFGSVVIAGKEDNYGELTDLSDDDISDIVSRIGYVARVIKGEETISPVIIIG